MKEDEKSPQQRLKESTAENCVCPHCGKDVTAGDIYVEMAHSIGEVYYYPACASCEVRGPYRDNDHWYQGDDN